MNDEEDFEDDEDGDDEMTEGQEAAALELVGEERSLKGQSEEDVSDFTSFGKNHNKGDQFQSDDEEHKRLLKAA